ncbi:hypothetical protein [Rhodanobacter hydrolyticus]|uniref:hypothetical protein n=1 Tax=Rhodanobacter hydrolyticus TaxID=2250595 RepID=UPI00384D317D
MGGPIGSAFNYSVFISDEQRRRMLKGLFDNYYGPEYGAEVVFDTKRGAPRCAI